MITNKSPLFAVAIVVVGFGAVTALCSFYTIDSGHVGIVKTWGKAVEQVGAGLHFKVPFQDTVEVIEIRTRKNVEKMPSSSKEQLPLTVEVSANWTVNKSAAMDLFKKYGGLEQFEQRILSPRFRSATKDAIPKFTAEQLIRNRAAAITEIEKRFDKEMAEYPVSMDNVQIENIILPKPYLDSIQQKLNAKNLADAEQHKLDRQRLEAMREVNTADAKAKGIEKVAKADADAIRIKGEAEAKAIQAKAKALQDNPNVISLTQAEKWDGKLPSTVLGGKNLPILNLKS